MDKSIEALLEKFIRDECSEEEVERLLSYLQYGRAEVFHPLMLQVWQKLEEHPKVSLQAKEGQFENLMQSIRHTEKQPSKVVRWHSLRIAATLTGILLLSLLTYLFLTTERMIHHQTGFAETKEILLPDGSTVELNSNSQVTYAAAWQKGEDREVILEGEAFFDVTHQLNHQKFVVKTSATTQVEVLGTQFNVNNRHAKTEVVLQSGKVKLNVEDGKDVDMNPGEKLYFSEESKVAKKTVVDAGMYAAWRYQQLVFQNTTLEDIALVLADNYGYQILFEDPEIKALKFTGTVPTNKTHVLLQMLSRSFGLEIKKEQKTLLFKIKQ